MERMTQVVYIRAPVPAERIIREEQIVPVLLAAGPSPRLPFPKALAPFGNRTALDIAVDNCAGYGRSIVVLGCKARQIRRAVPAGMRVVINRGWRAGQHGSLLAALRLIPRGAAILIYPVDHPLLTQSLVNRIVRAFRRRRRGQSIVLPVSDENLGHPTIFAPELREEIFTAKTAREVVYADARRVKRVRFNSGAVWLDFNDPASYRYCLREYEKSHSQLPRRSDRRTRAVAHRQS
jgi:CTP:molybdopterin cytidylyltransferase MocA